MQLVQSLREMGMLEQIYYIQSAQPPFIHITREREPEKDSPFTKAWRNALMRGLPEPLKGFMVTEL